LQIAPEPCESGDWSDTRGNDMIAFGLVSLFVTRLAKVGNPPNAVIERT
jgi:hypothetical protein